MNVRNPASIGALWTKRWAAVPAILVVSVGTVIVAICAEVARSLVADEVAGSTGRALSSALALVLLLVLLVLVLQVAALRKDLSRVETRLPLSVAYFPADTDEHIVAMNDAARAIIEAAPSNSTISAINSYLEVYPKVGVSQEATRSLDRYLAAYERKFRVIKYRRLIQVKDWTVKSQLAERKEFLDQRYFAHYEKMLQAAAEEPLGASIGLFEAPALIPASFVIVRDGEVGGTVIWEIFRHRDDLDHRDEERLLSTLGVLIISDRGGALVSVFEDWFKRIEARGAVPARLTAV